MANKMAIANRLHRSGGIDFNVEFAVRQAGIQSRSNPLGISLYGHSTGGRGGGDELSVCEGEPLFTVKRSRGNNYSSVDSVRNPISCLSSLNGFTLPQDDKRVSKLTQQLQKLGTVDVAVQEKLEIVSDARDIFFSELRYSGISVTKYAYERVGKQQDQFVSTLGGLNTIYVDEAVGPGDTLCVDMPLPTSADTSAAYEGVKYDPEQKDASLHSMGFIQFKNKKGTPSKKVTLVVRKLPSLPKTTNRETIDKHKAFIRGFYDRGQVIGFCVTGGKRGERCDLVLQANSVGGGFAAIFQMR